MLDKTPQVFISYSWTSDEYQEKIIDLATRLRHDGVDVKLDVWDLKEVQDKYSYMEQCVTDANIDIVLIMSDKVYAEKADNRKGGVGNETMIISSEVYGKTDQKKFIPVLMERDEDGNECLPVYLKARLYCDLSGDYSEEQYEKLLRIIFEAPTHRKPELGKRPTWLTENTPDDIFPLKRITKDLKRKAYGERNTPFRDFIDTYIDSIKPFYVTNIDKDTYLANFKKMKEYRDAFLDNLNEYSSDSNFGIVMADTFELLYNTLYNNKTYNPNSLMCNNTDFDIILLHIWELFVCTVTYMLHFEMYDSIHDLLVHTYFLRSSGLGDGQEPYSYDQFRFHSKMLEEIIKPTMESDLSRKYTLTGHYVYNEREYLPIYTGKAMANADLFLYQVYNGLGLEALTKWSAWFPTLYVYAENYDSMWKRLKSRCYCKKIMPIFGVTSIQELKERIAKCETDREYHYSGSWGDSARNILSWINLDDIATLP